MINKQANNNKGFSIIELLMVLVIAGILAGFATLSFTAKDVFKADDQGFLILDVLKEARQRALTQRETMRVEISKSDRTIRIINENNSGNTSDDVVIQSKTMASEGEFVFDSVPANADSAPEESSPTPILKFKTSTHPLSVNKDVATLRFLPNGTVTDGGSNAVADNAGVTGATIYFWSPKKGNGTTSNNGEIIRAITILGASGNTRYWKCPVVGNSCPKWEK